jgi:outer membrane protein OmpA-like peptidoglycan-associated protein
MTFPEGTLFPYDSDQLVTGAREPMQRFAASLAKYPGTRTLIVGHTDSRGNADYNADLSERRAQSAAAVLAAGGIAPARIGTAGRGESEPIATNATDAGRQQNRRVEVAIFATAAPRRSGN